MTVEREPAILIVDDDAAAIHALHAAVEGMGRVRFALSGRDALRLADGVDFDLALLDATMPEMDGYELCRALRAARPDTAVIFVTAASEPAAEVRALEAGAVDFITKPFNPPVVRARVDLQLRLRELFLREAGERAAAEEERSRLAATLDSLLDPHVVFEAVRDDFGAVADLAFRYANAGAAVDFSSAATDLPGRRLLSVAPHFLGTDLLAAWIAAIESGQPARMDDIPCPCVRPGCARRFDVRASRAGKALSVTWRDVTDRHQAAVEREARAARDLQVQKADGLNRMAGAIAHLYNNLLGALLSNLELLQEGLPEDIPARQELSAAMAAADRAAKLSATLLTYVGQTPGRMDPMDLSQACRMILPGIQARMPAAVRIDLELPEAGPQVRANTEQLEQAVTQLVTNAAEAVGDGGGTVRLRVAECGPEAAGPHRAPSVWQPEARRYACIEVADEGAGIAEADIEKVFDPFFTTKFTGRGLGLSTVAGIARGHGGGVTVESRPGHGSRFRLLLPLSEEAPPRPAAQEAPAVEEGGVVLLVDDEPAFRISTRAVLRRLGYTVVEAGDGVEALEAYRAHPAGIRCLVSDVSMPRMDGWETLAEIRKLAPGLPAVLISGYDQAEVMSGEHAEWPDVYLAKPFRMAELRDALLRSLGARRS
jgi:CheY-like chemotaxis protein